jgi:hypothetical protein
MHTGQFGARSPGLFHAGRHAGLAQRFRTSRLQFRCGAHVQCDERHFPWPLWGCMPSISTTLCLTFASTCRASCLLFCCALIIPPDPTASFCAARSKSVSQGERKKNSLRIDQFSTIGPVVCVCTSAEENTIPAVPGQKPNRSMIRSLSLAVLTGSRHGSRLFRACRAMDPGKIIAPLPCVPVPCRASADPA